MTLVLTKALLSRIAAHGERAYPDEGAGFLLGEGEAAREVSDLLLAENTREASARPRRYLIRAEDYMRAEIECERRGLDLLGIFHSHPDHPGVPSDYDRDWAQPAFSYVITSIQAGQAAESRSWTLNEDRTEFVEEEIRIKD